MTPRSFINFAIVTALLVVAAIASVGMRTETTTIATDRKPVFPEIVPNLNKASAIRVSTAGGTFTVKRVDKGWAVTELNNYPVSFEKVKTALVDLSKLKFLEAKTSNPERYSRLEVEDVTAKDAKSTHVEVTDEGSKILATAIIGRRNASLFGPGRGGTYLRLRDDPRTWLAEGAVRIGTKTVDWVPKQIVDLSSNAVKRMDITEPGGKKFWVRRDSPKDKDFKLGELPKGKPQRGQWETNEMTKALEKLSMESVKLAGDVKFPDGAYVTEFNTFDGLVIRSEAAKVGKEYWGRFSASAEGATGTMADLLRKRAAAINARTKGYVYKLPESVGKRLACKLANMLEGAGIKACA